MNDIKNKFLELTSRTYPHGTEKDLYSLLGDGLTQDKYDNLFIKIGDSDTMFTAHLDTATSSLVDINHVIDGDIIKTDGKSILGADDKAGVAIMLYMIDKKVPGLYYFFVGEEVGCVGSKKVADEHKKEKIEGISKVVSFDRRGTKSVITYQCSKRCASDEFAKALALQFNTVEDTFKYDTDEGGVLTDSIQFTSIYPECTNISVGYQSEHTHSESQNIAHLEKLAIACVKVDWVALPVKRDPSKTEYRSYGGGYGCGYGYGDDWSDNDFGYTKRNYKYNSSSWKGNHKSSKDTTYTSPKSKYATEQIWFVDSGCDYISFVEVDKATRKYISVDLHPDRVAKEEITIGNFLQSLDLKYKKITWDGFNLLVDYNGKGHTSTADRNDLVEYLRSIDYQKLDGDLV